MEALEIEDPKMKVEPEKKGIDKKLLLIIVSIVVLVIVAVVVILILVLNSDSKEEDYGEWTDAYKKSKSFVSKLSLTEKLNTLYGTENCYLSTKCVGQLDAFSNSEVSFPGLCLQDGPAGLRNMKGTSISWQTSINTAATFNKDLMYKIGKAQGEENKEKGINAFLSPSVNIMRTPQAGRLWEGYGEDPFYAGVCAKQITKGIQDVGVMAVIKHFVGNDQETYRKSSSSNMDKKTMFDMYIEPFYRPIKESNVGAVMCSYNAVNKVFSCENKYLLTDVLRGILGFKGFVMSDWWLITNNKTDGFNSGLEVNMPGGFGYGLDKTGRNNSYWSNFSTYVQEGKITEERVTEAVTRIIASMYKLDQMENFPKTDLTVNTVTDERIKLHRQAATESQVLLKNDGILPISNATVKKVVVVGNAAFPRDCIDGDGDHQCYNNTNRVSNGHIPVGYGSGTTDFKYLVSPIDGIAQLALKLGMSVSGAGGMIYTDQVVDVYGTNYTAHVSAVEDIDTDVEAAKDADVVIVYVCADSGEKYLELENSKGDRADLDAWHNGNELVEAIVKVNENVVVVINAPAVINVPWLDKVRAVVFSGFAGMESGNAIADVLFGEVNPSGHLPYVWGSLEDYGVPQIQLVSGDDPRDEMADYDYNEGLYVGQRYFNKYNKKAIFPFGHGLSYTTFEYSDLSVKMEEKGLTATVNVKNAGKMKGSAVVLLYLTFPSEIGDYPEYILKGFEKVEVDVGKTKSVEIFADDHALSYFSEKDNNYVRVKSGKIKVYIGKNGNPSDAILNAEIDADYNK